MNQIILTPAKKARMELYDSIAVRYRELVKAGGMPSAVVDAVSKEMGVGTATIYKVLRLKGLNRQRIDRVALVQYHDRLVAEGVTPAEAKKMTASKYRCSKVHVYGILKMAGV